MAAVGACGAASEIPACAVSSIHIRVPWLFNKSNGNQGKNEPNPEEEWQHTSVVVPWPTGQMERRRDGALIRGRAVRRRHGQRQPELRSRTEEDNGSRRRSGEPATPWTEY